MFNSIKNLWFRDRSESHPYINDIFVRIRTGLFGFHLDENRLRFLFRLLDLCIIGLVRAYSRKM